MIKVLVVDDQVLIRAGLAALLRAAPDITVVGEAADGEQAIAMAGSTRPDVILMDIRMPHVDGITATRRILAQAETAPKIVVLTTFDLDGYVYAALRAGAAGFLLKETDPQRLIDAVTAVADGDLLFAPSVTRRLVEAFVERPVADGRQQMDPAGLEVLTPRELEILRLVGTGMTNAEIAVELTLTEATVKTHLHRTMTKLDLCSRAQAVVTAYETGLVTPRRESSQP